jgi:hypothetical protein
MSTTRADSRPMLPERLTTSLYHVAAAARGRALARRVLRRQDAPAVTRAHPHAFRPLVRPLSRDCDSVLDVGTGLMSSLELVGCRVKLGVDAHRPYLQQRRVVDAVPTNAPADRQTSLFVPGAVDLVTLIDVLDHFASEDARVVLRQAEAVAARRMVLFTPRGEFRQSGFDAFGLGGEEYQRHRSTWEPEDLAAIGYRVAVLTGLHNASNASFVEAFGRDAPPVDALLAWKDRG